MIIKGYGEFPFEPGDILIDDDGSICRLDDADYYRVSLMYFTGPLYGDYTCRTERAAEFRKATEEELKGIELARQSLRAMSKRILGLIQLAERQGGLNAEFTKLIKAICEIETKS